MYLYIGIGLITKLINRFIQKYGYTHHPATVVRVLGPVLQELVRGVPAVEYGHERDDAGRHPRDQQQERDQPLGDQHRVLERFDDRVVPVHADAAQMQYGRGAEVHVAGVPHVAHEVPEQPPAADQLAGVERHHDDSHQHVGERQRHDEVVGDHPKPRVPGHGHDHQQVAADRRQYDDGHYRRFQRHQHVVGPVHRVAGHLQQIKYKLKKDKVMFEFSETE